MPKTLHRGEELIVILFLKVAMENRKPWNHITQPTQRFPVSSVMGKAGSPEPEGLFFLYVGCGLNLLLSWLTHHSVFLFFGIVRRFFSSIPRPKKTEKGTLT